MFKRVTAKRGTLIITNIITQALHTMLRNPRSAARPVTFNMLAMAAACCIWLMSCGARPSPPVRASNAAQRAPFSCIVVGGGPDREHNQVALESNVRYVSRLLPPGSYLEVLFGDGANRGRNVQFTDGKNRTRYRRTILAQIDGPSSPAAFRRAITAVNGSAASPLLLYFTGHGSPDDGDYTDNDYDMWNDEGLSVSDLRTQMDRLSPERPKALVMVECFSGAFSDLVFAGAPRPAAKNAGGTGKSAGTTAAPPARIEDRPLRPNFCGFFASLANREAAGCTPELNEAEYHDFTSYFFAALSGRDRLGRRVTGADFNHDGRVGMDEAYAYTLLHDESIDTPVSTSDTFLRSVCDLRDDDIFATPYSTVLQEATPAQATVLAGLSRKLSLTGEDRLKEAYGEMSNRTRSEDEDNEDEAAEENTALWLRFVRTAKTVVLTREVTLHGTPQRQAELKRLQKMEQASLPLAG